MSNASALASVDIDLELGLEPSITALDPETPFRILVMGDFGGRIARPTLVDRDELDSVLGRANVEVNLPIGKIAFKEMEDFHPDRIYAQSVIFEPFRRARGKLRDGAAFAEATGGLTGWARQQAAEPPLDPANLVGGGLLEAMLERSEPAAAAPARKTEDLRAFIDRVVAPHLAPKKDPRREDEMAQIDAAIAALMRGVLHSPLFQAIESAWRSLDVLVRGLETGESLSVYLMQCPKTELPLVRTLPGDPPWAVISGLYRFEKTEADAALLLQLGEGARAGRAPFLAEAGADDPADANSLAAWQALRGSPEARSIGLALPRFLLRLPYGKNTSAIESFALEEMADGPHHERYLWGNPSILCAMLLGQSFSEHGWRMRPGTHSQVDGLPLHLYQQDGETVAKPCAEILMTDQAADFILRQGLMPLASYKNEDRVKLLRFQSVADPLAPLAGRW